MQAIATMAASFRVDLEGMTDTQAQGSVPSARIFNTLS